MVNAEHISLSHVSVFHMDENLDWEGHLLPWSHPYSFRGFMEDNFYGPIEASLEVRVPQRHWLEPGNYTHIAAMLSDDPADLLRRMGSGRARSLIIKRAGNLTAP